jgi:hypothetical protein
MKIDIARGATFELFIEDYFKRRGWTVKRAKGNVPGYDLILTKGRTSFYAECKHDIASDRTGNYALELASLEHTQSDYLIIGTSSLAYILPIEEARKLFNQYPKRQVGDFLDNYAAIVPKQVFALNYQRLAA